MPYKFNPFTGELDLVAPEESSGSLDFDADSGTATPVGGVLNVFGNSTQGTQTSAAGDTLTVSILSASETQKGSIEIATNAETIGGADSTRSIVSTGLKAKLGSQAAKALPFGAGDNAALGWTNALEDGEIVIGSTAGTPQAAGLTSNDGSIIITVGSNSIDLSTTGGGHNEVQTIDCDSGSVTPDASGIVELIGTSAQGITTSGSGNTATLTIANASLTQKGVVELATDAETIGGADNTRSVTAESLKAKLGVQTNKSVALGTGNSNALGWTNALEDGEIVIGSSAGTPQAANITSTDGSITITNGPNSINLSTTGGTEDIETIDGNTGTATPVAGVVSIVGDTATGISTAGSGDTLTLTNAVANNATTIAGAATNQLVVPAGLNAKLGSQTQYALPVGGGSTAAISWTAAPTNGQLIIGSTGSSPVLGNLTSSDGSVTITNGAGSIDLTAAAGVNFLVVDYTHTGGGLPATVYTFTALTNFQTVWFKAVAFNNIGNGTGIGDLGYVEALYFYSGALGALDAAYQDGAGKGNLQTNVSGGTLSLRTIYNAPAGSVTRILLWYYIHTTS